MASNTTIVVVAGARGKLGKLICEELLTRAAKSHRPVIIRGLVRKESHHADFKSPDSRTAELDQRLVIEPVDYNDAEDLRRVCTGAYSVVSSLQGFDDVIVGVQSRLLKAAIENHVERFIPSDFSLDFTKLPVGSNRNLDMRLRFHHAANEIRDGEKSSIQITSIYQGAFTELVESGWILFNYNRRQIRYFGSADTPMDFTTWRNTAEFTAAVALDPEPTPHALHVAGQRITPRQASDIAKHATGVDFQLRRITSLGALRGMIAAIRFLAPGKPNNLMPIWVGLQYAYAMALGQGAAERLDNSRYPDVSWESIGPIVSRAFRARSAP